MPRELNIALLGHGFMGKAHSYACLATPFFFNTGIEPVRKVIGGPVEGPVKQAAEVGNQTGSITSRQFLLLRLPRQLSGRGFDEVPSASGRGM